MPKLINRLSPRFVATVTDPGRYADGGNLYLHVDPSGAKRWVFKFQWHGRPKEMGLGPLRSVPLASARQAAASARETVAGGLNPVEERAKARRSAPLFGEFADRYIDDQESGWRSAKHISQWRYSVEIDAKKLRRLPVDKITTDDLLAVLKPIWAVKPETAKRCRGRIEKILDAAKARGFRTGENPAAWKGHLALMLPTPPKLTRGHLPAMSVEDLASFMAKLRHRPASSARALEFTILTAVRSNEALGARWCEFDFAKRIWTVPAERMKGKRDHRVPLSVAAITLLEEVRAQTGSVMATAPAAADFVFLRRPTQERLSGMAMEMLLRRMGVTDVCVHGFRSTFRDWAGEETNFPREIVEMSLAHLVGSEVERAYRRGDALERRREVMDRWAAFALGEVAEKMAA